MGLCLNCRSEAKVNGGKIESWQYQTIDEPCDACSNEVSHERIH